MTYELNAAALQRVAETHLGKTILISNRKEWSDAQIIEAYRSRYLIEAIFKDMKIEPRGAGGRSTTGRTLSCGFTVCIAVWRNFFEHLNDDGGAIDFQVLQILSL